MLAAVVAVVLLALCASLHARPYPWRTIRIIVPFAPGGPVDVVARAIAQRLTLELGRRVIVDNRPGANGAVGAALVAQAPPDGHTLLPATA